MSDQTLMYWGMVVTMFLLIAAMLTARELMEMRYDDDDDETAEVSE